MKKILSLLIATLTAALSIYSQAPGIFNYQGVARNSVGNALENKTITLRLSIHDISSAGPLVFQESRTVTTNPFGLFNIQVGGPGASAVTGSIATVNWAVGNKYLKVEIDPAGGTSFITLGVSQLASVPYALNALGAAPIGNAGGDLSGTYPNPTITKIRGINLSTATPNINSVLGFDGTSWGPMDLFNHWQTNGNNIYNSNSGFVGIGTTTPTANLHIKNNEYGPLLRLQGAFNYARMEFLDSSGIPRAAISNSGNILSLGSFRDVYVGSDSGDVNLISNGVFSMVIQKDKVIVGYSGENVRLGVGTVDPATKLHINQNDEAVRLSGNNTYMSFYNGSSYKGFIGSAGNDIEVGMPSGNPTGNLNFYTNGNNRMSILSSGITRFNKSDEAMRLSGNDSYISFYDGASYKGFVGATDNDIELGTPNSNANGNIVFYTKGAAQMVVQNDGRVRVGPVGCNIPLSGGYPPPKFSVFGSLGFKKDYPDYIGEWAIAYNQDRPPPHTPPFNSLKFYYNGGLKAWIDDIDGEWHDISDRRLKESFESYKPVLEGIKKLDVMTYHYKLNKTAEKSFGLIAQNVQQYFPEIVSSGGGEDNLLGIAYGKTGVLAIKAIQEQQVIIETLERKIETLEKRLAALESKLR